MNLKTVGLLVAASLPAGLAAPPAANLLAQAEGALPWAREVVLVLLLLLILGVGLFFWGAILIEGRRG